jgi:hypothetical protein
MSALETKDTEYERLNKVKTEYEEEMGPQIKCKNYELCENAIPVRV